MFGNWRIGRPFGIETFVHWSFWLLPGLILLSGWLQNDLPAALLDTTVLLGVFGCVVLHELGHALAARQYGIRTRDIVLYPIGGVARLERMPRSPLAEIVVALAGPAVNFLIIALLLPLLVSRGINPLEIASVETVLDALLLKITWANFFLAMFNLIPAFPMDGGRVLRALLTTVTDRLRATELATAVGTGFAIVLGVGALLNWFSPFMLILALFLFMVGQGELQNVRLEEAYRREMRSWELPEMTYRDFARTSIHPDGWEYDPQLRMWTLWRDGTAVQRVAMR